MILWARVGDGGDYEPFPTIDECIEYLNMLSVGKIERWGCWGFETPNYWGRDYVSLFWGTENAQPRFDLNREERGQVEAGLVEVFI